ncbi:RHS repeat-associated core domain-containing protein [Emergencia timonensis]|uniref:RHS repeat-associated core domain-containing protein n=2 Tax=Emergencia timonensis TaxID=1776384 RepID=UPI00082A58BC|nr:RHS repeat-associated core domain-containing protein [Emergencia timonensis]
MQETPKSLIWLRFTAEPRTGRFITRDSYRGERENADTWHLYGYCMNNPINRIDPSGHDAIVLKSNFLTRAIGHMAVLIKKGSNWRYFSWGQRGYKSPHLGEMANQGKFISVKGKQVYTDINKLFGRNSSSTKYRKYLYIKGNFSGSSKYIDQVKAGRSYRDYGFTSHNCSWMALEVLKHGNLSASKESRIEKMQYEYVWVPYKKKYVRKVKTVIPSTAFENLKSIFNVKTRSVIGRKGSRR